MSVYVISYLFFAYYALACFVAYIRHTSIVGVVLYPHTAKIGDFLVRG